MKVPALRSLRLRFLFASLLWVSIATGLAGFVISGLYRTHTTDQYREELRTHLIEIVGLSTIDRTGRPQLERTLSDPRFVERGSGFYWQIERAGKPALTSSSLGSARLDGGFARDARERWGWVAGPSGPVLEFGLAAPARDGGTPLRFTIAAEKRLIDDALAGFNRDLTLSLVVFALLMVGGATLQIAFGLRPLRAIAGEIDRLRQGKIARLGGDVPAEFSALVARLNALLDAQAAVVGRARVEAGNLAHGLRTPLALISNEADQLAERGEDAAAAFILAQSAQMQRQIDYHMTRAGAAGTRVTGQVANVAELVRRIVEAMRRLHAARGLTFALDIPDDLDVNCDPGDLSEIVSNLIDNGCKWARTGVSITARGDTDQVVITVEDDGPGIAPELRARVFDVGARLDESKDGRGLGLAISRDLAALYGGTIALAQSPGDGLAARLIIPRAEPAEADEVHSLKPPR